MTLSAKDITLAGRLSGVSCDIKLGEITAICGPNGAGKSTLLSVLAGLLAPDSGDVSLAATALADLPPRERAQAIGYLPQHGEIAWDVTVRNLIALGRLPYGDENSEAVDAAVKALDLEGLAGRPVSKLSGGERARALLARVLAGEPRWLLADEPLAALDLGHQLKLIAQLKHTAKSGVGVVIVLHDLALAMNHADHVLVLKEGKLAASGAPDEALSNAVVNRVWAVESQWIGTKGAQALVAE